MIEKRDRVYLELIRIFAIVFVVFNHTGINGSVLYTQYLTNDVKYWFWLFVSNFCRVNVPLFFMVSGSLLLEKNESLQAIFEKRIIRISCVLLLISVLHYLFVDVILGGTDASVKQFLKLLYSGKFDVVYWFLYAYISFLITLPFLRNLVKNMSDKHFVYLGTIVILFWIIKPVFEFLVLKNKLHLSDDMNIGWLAQTAVIYPVFGYYLDRKFNIVRINLKYIIYFTMIIICCALVGVYISYSSELPTGKYRGLYRDTFSFVNSLYIFILLKYLYFNNYKFHYCDGLISRFGSCTFGIYVFHVVIMKGLNYYWLWGILHFYLHRGFGLVAYIIIVMSMSLLVTLVLKKIPYINRIL